MMSLTRTEILSETHPSDEDLLACAHEGSERAFELLVQRYHPMLFQFVSKYVGSEEAQDLLQGVWLQLYLSLPRLWSTRERRGNAGSLHSWLYRVALNRCIDVWRKQKRESTFLVGPSRFSSWNPNWSKEGEAASFEIPDGAPLPEELAERNEMRQRVRSLVLALPPKLRAAVWLHAAYGLDFRAIGNFLQVPASTAKTYHYRGRTRVQTAFLRTWE